MRKYKRFYLLLMKKGSNRKDKGVYYIPHDLVKFITINLAKLSCGKLKPNNLHILDLNGIPYERFCYKKPFSTKQLQI